MREVIWLLVVWAGILGPCTPHPPPTPPPCPQPFWQGWPRVSPEAHHAVCPSSSGGCTKVPLWGGTPDSVPNPTRSPLTRERCFPTCARQAGVLSVPWNPPVGLAVESKRQEYSCHYSPPLGKWSQSLGSAWRETRGRETEKEEKRMYCSCVWVTRGYQKELWFLL